MVKFFTTKYQFLGRILLTLLLAVVSCVSAWAADSKWKNGGTFYGNQTLSESVTIPEGKTVTINGDLTIKPTTRDDITLKVEGELKVTGKITLAYYKSYYYGNVQNNGKIEVGETLSIESGSTMTVNGELTIGGNLENKGTMNIPGNVIVNGNATNSGTINMQGGILRIGTYESGKLKEGTGEFTLEDWSSLLYDKNGGKESYVEVRGDLNGSKRASIKSKNGGKGNLAVVGTYYDEVEDYGTYHPDWGVKYNYKYLQVTSVSFEKNANPDILLSANSYSIIPKNTEADNWAEAIASIFGFEKFSDAAKEQLRSIVEQYKSINPENLADILQEISTLLPITLNYFTAEQDGEEVVFEWQTSSEVNNDFFTIEYSIDGVHFKELLREDGNGTTSVTNDYYATATVENFADITYFRLKQTDFNGEYSYSDVIFVSIVSEETELYVFPNPTTDYVSVSGNVASAYVSDMYGRNMSCLQTSENTFAVAGLSVGTYYVVVSTKNGKKVLPFVKK